MAETVEQLAAFDLAWNMGVIPKTGEKVFFFFAAPGRAFFMASLIDPQVVLEYAERARKEDGQLYVVAARTVKEAREKLRGLGNKAQYGVPRESKVDNIRSDIVHHPIVTHLIDDYNAAVVTLMPPELQKNEQRRYVAILEERVADVARGNMTLVQAIQLLAQYVQQQHAAIVQLYPPATKPEGLPPRRGDTMVEILALTSPSGKMSTRAMEAAQKRISTELFGPGGMPAPTVKQPSEAETLLRQAQELRDLAARGMHPQAYIAQAEDLERRAAAAKNAQVSLFTQEWADSHQHRPTASALEELGPDHIPSPEGSKEHLAGIFSRIRQLMEALEYAKLTELQTKAAAEEVVDLEAMYEAGYNQYADAYGWEQAEELHEEIETEWDTAHGVVHEPHPASFEPLEAPAQEDIDPEQMEWLRRTFRTVRTGQSGTPETEELRIQLSDALNAIGDAYGLEKQRELESQLEQEYLGRAPSPAPSKVQRSLLEFGSDSGLTQLWPPRPQTKPSPMPAPSPRPVRRRPGTDPYRIYVSDPKTEKKAEWFWSWVNGYNILPALMKATGYEVVTIDKRYYLLMFETPDRAEALDVVEELKHSLWGSVRVVHQDRLM